MYQNEVLDQLLVIHLTNVAIQKTSPDYDPEVIEYFFSTRELFFGVKYMKHSF